MPQPPWINNDINDPSLAAYRVYDGYIPGTGILRVHMDRAKFIAEHKQEVQQALRVLTVAGLVEAVFRPEVRGAMMECYGLPGEVDPPMKTRRFMWVDGVPLKTGHERPWST